MNARLRHLWLVLTSGYWFVPMVMMLAAACGAFLLLYVDDRLIGTRIGWLYGGGADGAKTLLSTVAGSVITVAGVVFSITVAALTQASSQFGPRLLRNFMRDTGNQVVLGTFIGTFIYCLLVLRTIHGELDDRVAFVPQASVSVAVLMAVASIAVLVYFIHHVSLSLQAPSVVDAVLADLEAAISKLPPIAEAHEPAAPAEPPTDGATIVRSANGGYLQVIDHAALVEAARSAKTRLFLACRAGDYVIRGGALLHACPPLTRDDALAARIDDAFIFGAHGSTEQDIEYPLRQVVEVAVRALSPGINDPFTAINCIDAVGSAVCALAGRALPCAVHRDADGEVRVTGPVTTFAGFLDTGFNQIRQHGRGNVAVSIRMLEIFAACAPHLARPDQFDHVLLHASMVREDQQGVVPQQRDREAIERTWQRTRNELIRCARETLGIELGAVPA